MKTSIESIARGLLASLFVVCAFVFVGCGKQAGKESAEAEKPKSAYASIVEEQRKRVRMLEAFWYEEVRGVIIALHNGQTYPEVKKRYTEINEFSVKWAGVPIGYEHSLFYHPRTKAIGCVMTIDEGKRYPTIKLYLASLKDAFDALRKSHPQDFRARFANHLIVAISHEIGYLRYLPSNRRTAPSAANESSAWAETCRDVIVPLVEVYRAPLAGTEMEMYELWVRMKRNGDSPGFREAVLKRHETLASM